MNWLDYASFEDFLEKEHLTPEQGRERLLRECKTRGLL